MPIHIEGIFAGAEGKSDTFGTLYYCTGSYKGKTETPDKWKPVSKNVTLKRAKAELTKLAVPLEIMPMETVGFYLHSTSHNESVAYVKRDQKSEWLPATEHLSIAPGVYSKSSTPFKNVDSGVRQLSGGLLYSVATPPTDESATGTVLSASVLKPLFCSAPAAVSPSAGSKSSLGTVHVKTPASSVRVSGNHEGGGHDAPALVDGKTDTYWWGTGSSGQWIKVRVPAEWTELEVFWGSHADRAPKRLEVHVGSRADFDSSVTLLSEIEPLPETKEWVSVVKRSKCPSAKLIKLCLSKAGNNIRVTWIRFAAQDTTTVVPRAALAGPVRPKLSKLENVMPERKIGEAKIESIDEAKPYVCKVNPGVAHVDIAFGHVQAGLSLLVNQVSLASVNKGFDFIDGVSWGLIFVLENEADIALTASCSNMSVDSYIRYRDMRKRRLQQYDGSTMLPVGRFVPSEVKVGRFEAELDFPTEGAVLLIKVFTIF
jgi:hypothetical protein